MKKEFLDNQKAFDRAEKIEITKKLTANMGRVKKSIHRLEQSNKSFLKQISTIRKDRKTSSKISNENFRAITSMQGRSSFPTRAEIEGQDVIDDR